MCVYIYIYMYIWMYVCIYRPSTLLHTHTLCVSVADVVALTRPAAVVAAAAAAAAAAAVISVV